MILVTEMNKEQEILAKHKPKSPTEILEAIKEREKAKEQMEKDVSVLEANLREFASREDPIVDPSTGKVLCWVRRPSRQELESLVPPEIMEYRDSGKKVPPEVLKKCDEAFYEMMASLITKPKKDAEFWKNQPFAFAQIFQLHIQKIYEDLGIDVENF